MLETDVIIFHSTHETVALFSWIMVKINLGGMKLSKLVVPPWSLFRAYFFF